MNLFKLATMQLYREKQDYTDMRLIIDRAIALRRWIDKHGTKAASRIMNGAKVYQYGNITKLYDVADYSAIRKNSQPHTNKSYLLE